jgi:hypothetical protein
VKRRATYVNGITSGAMACLKTPAVFASDRQCLEAIWKTTGKLDPAQLAIGWIRNTQDLTVLALSENLLSRIPPGLEVETVAAARDLAFDAQGDLVDWLS